MADDDVDNMIAGIKSLDELNYASWRKDILTYLDSKGYSVFIRNIGKIPEEKEIPDEAGGTTTTTILRDITADDCFTKKAHLLVARSRCAGILKRSCGPYALEFVEQMDDPKLIWTTLEQNLGMVGTEGRQVELEREWGDVKQKKGETIAKYLQRFTMLVNECIRNNIPINDQRKRVKFTAGVWNDSLRRTMSGKTWDEIINIVHEEERADRLKAETKRMKNEEKKKQQMAFMAKQQKNRKKLYCTYCKKTNHNVENCNFKNGVWPDKNNKNNDKPKKEEANMATKEYAFITEDFMNYDGFEDSRCYNIYDPVFGQMQDCTKETAMYSNDKMENKTDKEIWTVDSGATSHMTPYRSIFKSYKKLKEKIPIAVGNNGLMLAEGIGSVQCMINKQKLEFKAVLHVPDLSRNLLSVKKVTNGKLKVQFYENICSIWDNNTMVTEAMQESNGKLYVLKVEYIENGEENALIGNANIRDEYIWHQRITHRNSDYLNLLKKQGYISVDVGTSKVLGKCKGCIEGKTIQKKYSKLPRSRAKQFLERLHADLAGPISPKSHDNFEYVLMIVDDATRLMQAIPISTKGSATEHIKNFINYWEKHTSKKVRHFRCDDGGEFRSKELLNYFEKNGIKQEFAPKGDSAHNGTAERAIRTLMEASRSIMKHGNVPNYLWSEAVGYSNYTINRLPTMSLEGKISPYEALYKKRPDLNRFRVFGSIAYALIPKAERRKMDEKTLPCIMMGYDGSGFGYKLWNPATEAIIIRRDVWFDEYKLWYVDKINKALQKKRDDKKLEDYGAFDSDLEDSDEENEKLQENVPGTPSLASQSSTNITDPDDINVPTPTTNWEAARVQDPLRRGTRVRYIPDRYHGALMADEDPKTVNQAMKSKQKDQWEKAIKEELEKLSKNGTWKIVDKLPEGKNLVGSRLVFKTKRDADGNVTRYKARLVAQGYTQEFELDYFETYAPVSTGTANRLILYIGVKWNRAVRTFDVEMAFTSADLKEEIYMRQPKGFEIKGHEGSILLLKKSLYGLKQSAHEWHQLLKSVLLDLGYSDNMVDNCLFYKSDGSSLIAIHVDDGIFVHISDEEAEKFIKNAQKSLRINDQGICTEYLGVKIIQEIGKRNTYMAQYSYTMRILEEFGMQDCKPVSTPISTGVYYSKMDCPSTDEEKAEMSDIPYRRVIGKLLYLAVNTRPDIATAVGTLARFVSNPGQMHWKGVKHIMRYLRGTANYGLRISSQQPETNLPQVYGFVDSTWGDDKDSRKSRSGYVFFLESVPISWKTTLQQIVALSSAEAEYVALASAVKEALWLCSLLRQMGFEQQEATLIYCDNQACISIAQNKVLNERSKHIDIRFHFVREAIEAKEIELMYMPTVDNIADIFTKPLSRDRFNLLRDKLNVVKIPNHYFEQSETERSKAVEQECKNASGKPIITTKHPDTETVTDNLRSSSKGHLQGNKKVNNMSYADAVKSVLSHKKQVTFDL